MRSVLLAPLALLASSLAACGGRVAGSTPSEPLAPEAPIAFGASTEGALYVVVARPDTGAVAPFGPPLPLSPASYELATMHVSADGARVAVGVTPKVGAASWTSLDSWVLLGDGARWQTIEHAQDLELSDASDDLSLLVTMRACPPSSGTADFAVSVVRDDGTHAFDDAPCTPGAPAAFIASIEPTGGYFVARTYDGALSLHPRDGAAVVLATPAQQAIVGPSFATSLLLADAPRARWIDTSGRPLTVPGWDRATSTPCGLQALDGGLFALADRALVRVADLPAGVDPATVRGVRGEVVITRADDETSYHAIDHAGATLASYTPPPARSAPRDPGGTPQVIVGDFAWSPTARDAWLLLSDDYETVRPDAEGADVYERADDLWLVVDRAGTARGQLLELRRGAGAGATSWPWREYVPSSTGAHVLFAEAGALHAVDVDAGEDRELASRFTIAPVPGTHRHAAK